MLLNSKHHKNPSGSERIGSQNECKSEPVALTLTNYANRLQERIFSKDLIDTIRTWSNSQNPVSSIRCGVKSKKMHPYLNVSAIQIFLIPLPFALPHLSIYYRFSITKKTIVMGDS